jgi:hypothetical protein
VSRHGLLVSRTGSLLGRFQAGRRQCARAVTFYTASSLVCSYRCPYVSAVVLIEECRSRLSPPMRWLIDHVDTGQWCMEYTGFGLNLVNGNFEFGSDDRQDRS